jgi:segregation and condensation protein A
MAMLQETQIQSAPAAGDPAYRVRLENFEGPLDLLLHLIREDEIEIWEISISRITRQYLDTLAEAQALDVEIAGEFLVMAATLMRLKSRGLLPRPAPLEEGEARPQTEEELIRQLLTYKTFKEAAAALRRIEEARGPRFPRGFRPELPEDYAFPLADIDLYALVQAFAEVRERRTEKERAVHAVRLDDVRLEDQLAFLLQRLEETGGQSTFSDLFPAPSRRLTVAVTFFAALELARQQVVSLMQDQPFEEIWIRTRVSEEAARP